MRVPIFAEGIRFSKASLRIDFTGSRAPRTASAAARGTPDRPDWCGGPDRGRLYYAELHSINALGALVGDVTDILSAIEQGDPHAADQLMPLVYDELRKLAAVNLAHEKPGADPAADGARSRSVPASG